MSQIPENNPEGWNDRAAEAAGQPQPGYYAPAGAGSYAAPQSENVPVLSEFDHLFRDSAPDTRRSVIQDVPSIRGGQGGPVQPGQYPASPQWPAQAGGYPEAQVQQQAPAQYAQYPGQDQGQAYQQQVPQQQYDQTQYLSQSQSQTQAVEYQGQYQQPGGYGDPSGYQPGQPGNPGDQQWQGGGKGRRTPILVGAVALVAVVGLIVALNSGGSTPQPKKQPVAAATTAAPTAAEEATELMGIVSQSGTLRSEAISAVDDLTSSGCSKLGTDQSSLQATSTARAAQAAAVSKLDVSKLSGGTQVAADLAQAWTASATSDAAYAKIAGDLAASNATNCKSGYKSDPNYSAAVQADGVATRAKNAAAALWNTDLTIAPASLAQIDADQL